MEKATEEKKEKRISKKVILTGSNPKERFTAIITIANSTLQSLLVKYESPSKYIEVSAVAESVSVRFSTKDLFISFSFSELVASNFEIRYVHSDEYKEKWRKSSIKVKDVKEMVADLADHYFNVGTRESPLTAEIKTAVKAEVKQALLNKKFVFKVALEDIEPIL